MDARARYATLVAVFAAVLFLALAICASGIISLVADREVLTETDAGPLVAPVMFVVAGAALFLQLVRWGIRDPSRRISMVPAALVIGVIVYLFFVVSGSTLYSLGKGRPLLALLFFAANSLGPFALAMFAIAVVVALAYLVLISYRESGGAQRTPRWFWENKDDRDRDERN